MTEQIPEALPPAEEATPLIPFREWALQVAARTAAATLAASATYTVSANINTDLPAFEVGPGPTPARTVDRYVPGTSHEEPGTIATQTVNGPGLHMDELQKHAPTFKPSALNDGQRQEIERYVDRLFGASEGVKTVHVDIMGRASDEDYTRSVHDDRNLGKPSPDNERLAQARGRLVAGVMAHYADEQGYDLNIDKVDGEENIWSLADIRYLHKMAKHYGKTVDEVVSDYNHGRADYLDSDTRGLLFFGLTKERGADAKSTVTRELRPNIGPCDVVVSTVKTPGHFIPELIPGDDGWKFRIGIMPVPMVIRRRRKAAPTDPDTEPQAEEAEAASVAPEPVAEDESTRPNLTLIPGIGEDAPEPVAEAESEAGPEAEPEAVPESVAGGGIGGGHIPRRSARRLRRHERYRDAISQETGVFMRHIRGEATQKDLNRAQRQTERARRAAYADHRPMRRLGYAALAPLLLVIPLPFSHDETADNVPPAEQCVTYDVQQGSRTTDHLTTLGLFAWAKLHHETVPSMNIGTYTQNSTLYPTHKPFTTYYVDAQGHVARKDNVPATAEPPMPVAPTFK